MDHSPAAMAKIPVAPPRPPHSARDAKAIADKDEIIAAMFGRLEQLEGKLTLMYRELLVGLGFQTLGSGLPYDL